MELSYAEYTNYLVGTFKRQENEIRNSKIISLENSYYSGYYTAGISGMIKSYESPNDIINKMLSVEEKFDKQEFKKEVNDIKKLNEMLGI